MTKRAFEPLDTEQSEIVRDHVGAAKFARMTERGRVRVWNKLLREMGLLPPLDPKIIPDMTPYTPTKDDEP